MNDKNGKKNGNGSFTLSETDSDSNPIPIWQLGLKSESVSEQCEIST